MSDDYRPLAARMRPTQLAEFIGQQHIVGPDKPLRQAIEAGALHSMVFWGPPGVGKTSLARLISGQVNAYFISLSAVLSGVKDIRSAAEQAKKKREKGQATLLFIDEVHRFNKAQQDAFLPHVEEGTFFFIGASTENPSFELNNALLSRVRVYVLKPLDESELLQVLDLALNDQQRGLGKRQINFPDSLKQNLVQAADGDARRALNLLETLLDLAPVIEGAQQIEQSHLKAALTNSWRRFDKGGDQFYEQISALHKSVRGSDPDAALYWLCRMLDGGCDPLYIARRMLRMASEDIGNAEPRALQIAINAWQTMQSLGSPEGELAIAQALVFLAVAPKSNRVYLAFKQAMADVRSQRTYPVPMHLCNAPTQLFKELGHGQAYRYPHDEPGSFAKGVKYFPDELAPRNYYQPTENGLEIKISEKLNYLRKLNSSP